MSQLTHCSLGYHEAKIENLPTFANGVSQGVFGNPLVFKPAGTPPPPFLKAAFDLLVSNEETTYAAYKQGGLAQKPAFNIARTALMAGLDKMATYVDTIALGDENTIILGGFVPTKNVGGTAKFAPPQAPQNVKVSNGTSTGELNAECESYGNGHNYGCIVSEGQALGAVKMNAQGQIIVDTAQPNKIYVDVNHDRKKKFTGLLKGVDYYFYFYVINTVSVSPLSVAVMQMSL